MKRLRWGLILLIGLGYGGQALAKDFLLAVTRPNQLHVIDAQARNVEQTITIPGNGIPSTIAIPDDGKVAYPPLTAGKAFPASIWRPARKYSAPTCQQTTSG
ncbi:MAG: hypothetical protein R3F37_15370 [Candidatus Competibacteraceae bacterium]